MSDQHDHLLKSVAATMHPGESVLVALSGGADSVTLLASLVELGHRCVAFHCNYHLRGEESDLDERHARDIAARLNVPIEVLQCDVAAFRVDHPGTSIEMACRELRYNAFYEALARHNLDSIAVGHHLEDNIETMMLNLLRGTGIKGLAAMKPRRGNIVRPMLQCSKQEILDYLSSRSLTFVTDSSNLSSDYRRNALRNEIIPLMQRYFPDCISGMSHTMHALDNQRDLLALTTKQLLHSYTDDGAINLRSLVAEHPLPAQALFEILNYPDYRGFNESIVSDIIASSEKSGLKFSGDNCTYLLDHGMLIPLSTEKDSVDPTIEIDINNLDSFLPALQATIITPDSFHPRRDNSTAYFDLDRLADYGHIILRHPRPGDRLQPWGMKGSRLLSDIFTDLHMRHDERKNAWALEADGNILWLVGIRASRHAAVSPTTRRILRLTTRPDSF